MSVALHDFTPFVLPDLDVLTAIPLFDAAPIGLAITSIDGRWLRVNRHLCGLLGYSEAELLAMTIDQLTHREELAISAEARRQLMSGYVDSCSIEKRYRCANGKYLWANVSVSEYNTVGGRRCFIAAVQDISSRKRIEAAYVSASRRLRMLLSSAPIALWATDADGRITLSEGRLLEQLDVEPGELVGASLFELCRNYPEIVADVRQAIGGQSGNTTRTVRGLDFDVWYAPLTKDDGQPDGAIVVALDVTERRQLENKIQQGQKLEAVGRLAAGAAHDFNNLLTVILGFTEMSMARFEAHDPTYEDLQEIMHACRSASGLTRDLLAFSRQRQPSLERCDLSTLVRQTERMIRSALRDDIEFSLGLTPEPCEIEADPGQIEQVLVNLAVNARDAMPDGGRLHIATERDEFGKVVRLIVSDTGTGMTPDVRSKLFQPFFTTKSRGIGTGLGLASVQGIIQQAGGAIEVASTLGEGSTFTITLPATVRT